MPKAIILLLFRIMKAEETQLVQSKVTDCWLVGYIMHINSFVSYDSVIILFLFSLAVPHLLSVWTKVSSSGAWTVEQSHWFVP